MGQRSTPAKVTTRLRCRDRSDLEITAGELLDRSDVRFLEMRSTESGQRVALEWEASTGCRPDPGGDRVAYLRIDDRDRLPVVLHRTQLFVSEGREPLKEPFAPEELAWLGEHLSNVALNPRAPFLGLDPQHDPIVPQLAAAPAAVSCIADFTGAGAGIGGAAGGAAGSAAGGVGAVPGAAGGAAIGGAAGAAVGIGYCVVGPVLKWLFDW